MTVALGSWRVAGTYLESCNCEAVCPCRRVDGVLGGRSTYGECLGALSWHINEGQAGETALTGLNVALACRYSDDEPGSPWSFLLFVDERGDRAQRGALADIFTGRAGGTVVEHFPWAFKPSHLLGLRQARIEVDHTPRSGWFRAGDTVTVRISGAVAGDATVTCVIPGHNRAGQELVASELTVADELLAFRFEGNCGYASTFEYSG